MQIADSSHTHLSTRDTPQTAAPPPPPAQQTAPPKTIVSHHLDSSGSTDDGTSATFAGSGNTTPYKLNTVA
jgi:hypothetical protein